MAPEATRDATAADASVMPRPVVGTPLGTRRRRPAEAMLGPLPFGVIADCTSKTARSSGATDGTSAEPVRDDG